MFGSLRKMLGIEGAKLEVFVNEPVKLTDRELTGLVKMTTLTHCEVTSISLKLIEKYTRGRKDSKLINEYIIGFIELEENFSFDKNDIIEIPFSLPFKIKESEMDKIEKSNFISSGLVKLAKLAKGVKSEYRIEAEAHVKGTKLNPLFKKEVLIK